MTTDDQLTDEEWWAVRLASDVSFQMISAIGPSAAALVPSLEARGFLKFSYRDQRYRMTRKAVTLLLQRTVEQVPQ